MRKSKSGVYFWNNPLDVEKNIVSRKIGFSEDITGRFKCLKTYFRPEDNPLKYITEILYSKEQTNTPRFLEYITHQYYSENREYKNREIFSWDSEKLLSESFTGLKDFFACKGIFDLEIYKKLSDVPFIEKKPIQKFPAYTPNNIQKQAVDNGVRYFKQGCNLKGQLLLAPGLGKTYITGFILKELELKNIIIFTPQIMISEEWYKMLLNLGFLDKDIFICDSEDKDIKNNYKDLKHLSKKILISTYQTYSKKSEYFEDKYDMVIYDEAHHLATGEYFRKSLILTGHKLFLTATPKIIHTDYDTGELSTYSLDNKDTYGEPIYSMGIESGISSGLLTDYRILYFREKNDNIFLDSTEHIKTLVETYRRNKIVVFYNTKESCKKAKELLNYKNCDKYYIDGETEKIERKMIIDMFIKNNDKPQVLFNINVLGEGVSIDCIDTVLLMEDRKSTIVLTQILGRMLRLYQGKTESLICVPERCVDTFSVLLHSIYHDIGDKNKDNITRKILFEGIKDKEKTYNIKKDKDTEIQLIEIGKDPWEWKYNLCLEWERENEGEIPQLITYKNLKIGTWLSGQIQKYRGKIKFKLKTYQLEKLKCLRTFNKLAEHNRDEDWEFKYNLCLEFEEKNGYIKSTTEYKGIKLCKWLQHQLEKYRGRKNKKITDIQKEKLSILKTFQHRLKTEKKLIAPKGEWNELYNLCLNFEKENKEEIKYDTEYKGVKIGHWLIMIEFRKYQRLYTEKKSKITSEQLEKLKLIKTFKNRVNNYKPMGNLLEKWEYKYNLCLEYQKENHTIPFRTEYKGEKIGDWLGGQFRKYKNNKLTQEHLEKLKLIKSFKDSLNRL
jgi:superfamily II DNA or RNA helicase